MQRKKLIVIRDVPKKVKPVTAFLLFVLVLAIGGLALTKSPELAFSVMGKFTNSVRAANADGVALNNVLSADSPLALINETGTTTTATDTPAEQASSPTPAPEPKKQVTAAKTDASVPTKKTDVAFVTTSPVSAPTPVPTPTPISAPTPVSPSPIPSATTPAPVVEAQLVFTASPVQTVSKPAPTLTFSANSPILKGHTTKLVWSATNATSCTAVYGWSGTKALSGSQIMTPTATTTYGLICTGAGGTVKKSLTVRFYTGPTPVTGTTSATPTTSKTTTPTPTPAPTPAPAPAPAPAPTTYDSVVLADSPNMYLKMNSMSSGKEIDATGNGHSGTYKGGTPTSVTLPNGDSAADFNGSSQYLTVPSSAALSISTTKALTWEAWIRPDTFSQGTASDDGYVDWMGKCENYSPSCEWEARIYNSSTPEGRPDRLSAYVFNPSAGLGSAADWQPSGSLSAGHWIHVVAEYQTSTTPSGCSSSDPGSINIWVDGVEQSFASHEPTGCMSQYSISPKAGSSPLDIGTMAMDTWFKGAVGKVAVYDHLLTQSQISAHFKAMSGKSPSGSCGNTCTASTL